MTRSFRCRSRLGLVVRALVAVAIAATNVAFAQSRPQGMHPEGASGDHATLRFTMLEALRAMVRGHPALTAVRAANRAAEYDVTAASLWTNPQLNVIHSRALSGSATFDPVFGYTQIGISQLIELAGLPGARRQVAEYALAAARADGRVVQLGLMFDVYTAFVNLTAAVERLAVLRDTAAELERANNIVQTRVREGANPLYDGSRIAIALAQARAEVGETEAEVLRIRGDLEVSVGPYASTLRGLPEFDLYNLPPLLPLGTLLQTTRTARPDLVAARNRMHAANAQTRVAQRSVFQGVVLYAGAGLGANYCDPGSAACTGMPNVGSREVDVNVGLTVPIPVIDRGQGTVPAAEARAVSSARVADALGLAAEQRVTAIYRSLVRRREILAEYRDTGVTRTAQMRSQAESGYLGGRLSVLELVDAYTSYRDARLRLVSLAADARTAEVELGRATGLAP